MYVCTHVLFLLKRYEFTNLGMPAGSKGELKRVIPQQNKMKYSGIPIFRTSYGNENWFRKIGELEKSGVKLQCSTEKSERLLVRVVAGGSKN